jgi:hypothetical protein
LKSQQWILHAGERVSVEGILVGKILLMSSFLGDSWIVTSILQITQADICQRKYEFTQIVSTNSNAHPYPKLGVYALESKFYSDFVFSLRKPFK